MTNTETLNIPRNEYPRPQFERELWMNLNGQWDFDFDDNNVGEAEKWYAAKSLEKKITVPFCYQSSLSGIGDKSMHDVVWYKRSFTVPESFKGKRVKLNFGAVDYIAKVWVNGNLVGSHKGGHIAFSFDITDSLVEGENLVAIRVEDDSFDCSQPRGKQTWKEGNFGCWYTRTTGIWQTVWLEAVDKIHIERVKMTPDIDNRCLHIEVFTPEVYKDTILETEIHYEGKYINTSYVKLVEKRTSYSIDVCGKAIDFKVSYWWPGDPHLYDIKFKLKKLDGVKDEVNSYFGMRKISVRDGKIMLNNKEYYQRLILDQGYFGDGLLTAESEQMFIDDIKKIKSMGFNGLRKHQKIEDPRFLYWCDKLGMLVWAEMPSTYEFDDRAVENIMYEWTEAVKQQYNHPSIIIWTLMNESWGINEVYANKKQQSLANALYYMVKSMDQSRLLVSNDGWEHTITDILTIHDYVEKGDDVREDYKDKEKIVNGAPSKGNTKRTFAEGYSYEGQPVIISEYGGIAFAKDSGWGYGNKVETEEKFLVRFESITKAFMELDYACGYCYTQLTDVEQEVNGLMDWNHNLKFDPKKIHDIVRNIKKA
ncbi:beta galactosidase jelly roll domain-containing protein [Clostridium swellfunianum]|uniref:glycoside hydrolase family 2 protein n=1 Tax=Clostridium swellfunianum TaxID=1367462 RepID=UPI00202E58C0|nr:sugar-binding domain-containing protein [Clostridium swellfunianum]MCM0649661.1 beta galactosidase jelly roll domain-containing protein [Clostridium swellfunianum]